MSRHIIAPEANQDLDEISNYFLACNLEAGERWFQAFNERCKQLVRFPEMGRGYPQIRSYLRGLPLEGFIIFYRVKDDVIEIMRVVSGRRNLGSLFADAEDE
ncbi:MULTISPECIES: type II toxin-antitoxin system RelE/ParE family toxin [Cyanophyceae]|uniref:type II toxin-antitoxin system RelE/ParE family toxin n=1 Tax=Cyanophyceae TaxID=3028117 RepID=UPI00168385B7|nr:type II toxin-antitoxin system RelE/ParE family toxin [Trichocoleus sp. FACHB-40]MBD2002201.1 type II toxin-antitoxin system RelE/ParE family toxin [Trichocoleus sp. FACHB-40]